MKIIRKKHINVQQKENNAKAFFQKNEGAKKGASKKLSFFHPKPHQNNQKKLNSEQSQVNQQMSPMIQMQVKPPGTAADYLPTEGNLENKVGDLPENRRAFLVKFLNEIYPIYRLLEEEKVLHQVLGVGDHSSKKETLDQVDPIPSSPTMKHEGRNVKTEYSDKGARVDLDPFSDYEKGMNLLEEFSRYKNGEIADEYKDLKLDHFLINSAAKTKAETAEVIMQLRKLSNVLNRVYSAYEVSKDEHVGLSLSEVLALYRQEGNMDVPSSMESLKSGIPTGKYDSRSLFGYGRYWSDKVEMSHMVLILNKNHFSGEGSDAEVKLRALKIYINHIAGLDVINRQGDASGLAAWSVINLVETGKIDESERTTTIENYERIWQEQIDNIELERKGDGIVVAPKDPTKLVSVALKEASIFLERYKQVDRVFGEEENENLPGELPLSLAYMQFNSSKIINEDRPKVLIKSALRNAKNSTNTRFKSLKTELKVLGSKVGDFDEIKKWILGQEPYETSGPNNRWDLTMDFMEHAGKRDWGNNWAKIRGNASLLRSQTEFYDVAFDESERNWLTGLERINQNIEPVKNEFFNQSKIEALTSQWENELKEEAKEFKIDVSKVDDNWVVTLILDDQTQEIARLKNVPPAPDSILNITRDDSKGEAKFIASNVANEQLIKESQLLSTREKEPLVLTSPLRDEFGYIKALPFVFEENSSYSNNILALNPETIYGDIQNALLSLWEGNNTDKIYNIKMTATFYKDDQENRTTDLLKTLKLEADELIYSGKEFVSSGFNEITSIPFAYEDYQVKTDYLDLNKISKSQLLWLNLEENFVNLFLKVREDEEGFKSMNQISKKMKRNHKRLEVGKEGWFNETTLNQSLSLLEASLNQGVVMLSKSN